MTQVQTLTNIDDVVKNTFKKSVTSLHISPIKNGTIDDFYKQISENLIVGTKAYFLVSRDVSKAYNRFKKEDCLKLREMLNMSESTWNKFVKVGNNKDVINLYSNNKLPDHWTTQYFLTTLKPDEFDKVRDQITVHTSKDMLLEMLGRNKSSTVIEKYKTSLLSATDIFQININDNLKNVGGLVTKDTLKDLKRDLESVIKKYSDHYKKERIKISSKHWAKALDNEQPLFEIVKNQKEKLFA
jgi:hypothetical protein